MGVAPSNPCPGGGGGGGGSPTGYPAAMSVNLAWYMNGGGISALYNSCRVVQSASGSYFCMEGFNGGYFGIQEVPNYFGGTYKRVIFSLWDQGGQPSALYAGAGVTVERFGGEGTGLKTTDDGVGWSVGETVSCLILYAPTAGGANYAAYYLRGNTWKHMATVMVPGAGAFNGHYSFVEDFLRNGQSSTWERNAVFGPVWGMTNGRQWVPAYSCRFGASNSPQEYPEAINTEDAGAGMRTLETGGSIRGAWKLDSVYSLAPGAGGPPQYLPQFPNGF